MKMNLVMAYKYAYIANVPDWRFVKLSPVWHRNEFIAKFTLQSLGGVNIYSTIHVNIIRLRTLFTNG